MLPQERAPLVGVAPVAGLVDRRSAQQRRADSAVRVMAVGAGHPASDHGMGGKVVLLRALLQVAGKTHLRLGDLVESRILRLVDGMARRARDVASPVRTCSPVDTLAALVAVQTGTALHVDTGTIGAAESEIGRRPRAALVSVLDVGAA